MIPLIIISRHTMVCPVAMEYELHDMHVCILQKPRKYCFMHMYIALNRNCRILSIPQHRASIKLCSYNITNLSSAITEIICMRLQKSSYFLCIFRFLLFVPITKIAITRVCFILEDCRSIL